MSAFDDFMNKAGQDITGVTGTKVGGVPVGQIGNDVFTGGTLGGAGSAMQGKNPLKNTPVGAIAGIPTDAQTGAQDQAQKDIDSAVGAYNGLTPPSFTPVNYQGPQVATEGPSAMSGVTTNPANNAAQTAQLAALSRLSANGGRNAASDANLASIQANENANARGQRDAIMQNAAARGQGGSGASLLAQLQGSQAATDRQSAEDLGVAGQEANTAIGAGQAAAGIGSNMENQEFGEGAAKAAAADNVARFNAGNQQAANNGAAEANNASQTMNNFTAPQQTYADTAQKAAGQAGAYEAGTGYYGQQAAIAAQTQGNQLGAATQLGAAGILAGGRKGGGAATGAGADVTGDAMAGDAMDAAMVASTGGRIPGSPVVPGNSTLNDIVPLKTSPGEVVVPRTLAIGGSQKDIGNFVKHPPTVGAPGQNKEAMLSALRNLSRRRMQ